MTHLFAPRLARPLSLEAVRSAPIVLIALAHAPPLHAQDEPIPIEEPAQESPPVEEEPSEMIEALEEEYQRLKAQEKSEPEEPVLSPEKMFLESFDDDAQRERAMQQIETSAPAPRRVWRVSEAEQASAPQLVYGEPITCLSDARDGSIVNLQCDHDQKRCLLAEASLPKREESLTQIPTGAPAQLTMGCSERAPYESLALIEARGYTLEPALLEAPYGYRRDADGQAFQRFFDLRSRFSLGASYAITIEDGGALTQSVSLMTGSTYEHYSTSSGKRKRFRFLQGEVLVAPTRVEITAFEYINSRSSREPLFFLTELIGEPSRHDVYLNVGPMVRVLHLDHRAFEAPIGPVRLDDSGARVPSEQLNHTSLDMVQGALQWEVAQGEGLEDYVGLRLGGGLGVRPDSGAGAYVFPEMGFEAAWLLSPRGLLQLTTRGHARYAVDGGNTQWLEASARGALEWVFLAINDQPLSLYVEPRADWLQYRGAQERQREVRVSSGVRISLLTPTPENPENYKP